MIARNYQKSISHLPCGYVFISIDKGFVGIETYPPSLSLNGLWKCKGLKLKLFDYHA